jgi:virginiamycin B lyase
MRGSFALSAPKKQDKWKTVLTIALTSILVLSFPLFSCRIENSHSSSSSVRLLGQGQMLQFSSNLIRIYPVPTNDSGPNAIVSGPNKTLWFVEFTAGKIGEFFSSNDSFHEFPIPENASVPASLAIDQFGTIWFSDQKKGSPSIWSFNPLSEKFHQYLIPTATALPLFIVVDNQHNIWFTETTGYKLGELTYPNYSLSEYAVPVSQFEPLEMFLDQKSSTIWVTFAQTTSQVQPGIIASFNMASKKFENLYKPPFSLQDPVGIVVDNNGNVWVSEHRGSSITELVPSNSTWRKFQTSLPPASYQVGTISACATLAIDKEGNLWFVEHFSNRVGKLNPSTGMMEEFTIPGPPGPNAYSVLNYLDPNGNFWFTNFVANSIDMIPANATTSIGFQIGGQNNETRIPTVNAGQSIPIDLEVKNLASTTQFLTMNVTSSFSVDGTTSPNEFSFNVTADSIQLGSNQSLGVIANITPDVSLASGIYSISIIFAGVNSTSIQTFFIKVSASPFYFFYHLGDYFQYIIIGGIAILAVNYLYFRRVGSRKNHFIVAKTESNPEPGVKG